MSLGNAAMGARVTAKQRLREGATRHRGKADALDMVADMLPEKLTDDQDDALYSVIESLLR